MILKNEIEKLLLKNWANFLDIKILAQLVLSYASEHLSITIDRSQVQQNKIKVSKFNIVAEGFILWVDFTITRQNDTIIGTSELFLYNNGEILQKQTIAKLHPNI